MRVTKGEVYDVAVDCRPHSATFGKWVGVTLSEDNKKMFYIPEGFAHGFLVLSDVAEFCYKCTDVYDPTSEVRWTRVQAPASSMTSMALSGRKRSCT